MVVNALASDPCFQLRDFLKPAKADLGDEIVLIRAIRAQLTFYIVIRYASDCEIRRILRMYGQGVGRDRLFLSLQLSLLILERLGLAYVGTAKNGGRCRCR